MYSLHRIEDHTSVPQQQRQQQSSGSAILFVEYVVQTAETGCSNELPSSVSPLYGFVRVLAVARSAKVFAKVLRVGVRSDLLTVYATGL